MVRFENENPSFCQGRCISVFLTRHVSCLNGWDRARVERAKLGLKFCCAIA